MFIRVASEIVSERLLSLLFYSLLALEKKIMESQSPKNSIDIWHTLLERGLVLSCLLSEPSLQTDEYGVVFCVGKTYYAIPLSLFAGVQQLGNYVPLPFMHPAIIGATSFQGQPLMVVDICSLGDSAPIVPHVQGKILVLQLEHTMVGFLAESIAISYGKDLRTSIPVRDGHKEHKGYAHEEYEEVA